METVITRNTHSLYSVMSFVAAIIVLILIVNNFFNEHKSEKHSQSTLFFFIFLYCVQDGIWGLFASGIINSNPGLMSTSAIFHIFSSVAPIIWSMYFCNSFREEIRYPKNIYIYSTFLMIIQIAMIITNFFTKFMFYVDKNGNYQTTEIRGILFYLQFTVYAMISIIALVGITKQKEKSKRSIFISFFSISFAPVIFSIFQMFYPDAPANSIGLSIACILIQIFLSKRFERQVRELKAEAALREAQKKDFLSAGVIKTLSLEYGPLFLADLNTGALQIFRSSNMQSSLTVQQLASEIHEYIPFICEYAERHVAVADREAFLDWAEVKHLNSIITTENISDFTYQQTMNGEQRFYQLCCGRVQGSEELMVFGFRNVDATVKKEEKSKTVLETALKEAKVANEAKTRLLFNMSHDIRTPMNAIIGFTDLAKKNINDTERATDYLKKLDDAGHHLLDIINEILDMSRIESGKMELHEAPMNLLAASVSTIAICTEAGRQRGVTVELHHGAAGALWVYCDETRINQIAMNIISNAVKYTNPGGRVDIWVNILDVNKKNNTVSLEMIIKDTGIGMSKEFIEKIYEPFERSSSSTASGIQGTGLGMAIVKQLVDLMNGKITVSSELGVGTTVSTEFTFRLAKPIEEESPEEIQSTLYNLEGKHILLVEDNAINQEIAREILKEKGITVDIANDGDLAIEIMKNAEENQYDLILMDVQMPRMNGYDATREIRKLSNPHIAGIPIIAMTANVFDEDRKNVLDAGMNGHLSKPIEPDKMFKMISDFVSQQ